MFYSGFNTCPSRGLKANTLRTALSQNGEYIFIRARGQRSNLNSSEFKGCNSNVRGRVHLQAARRLFKVSSEIVEAQCVVPAAHSETNSAPFALAFGTAFNRDARSQIGGENEIFRTTFRTIHGRHNRRLFNSNELFFQTTTRRVRDYGRVFLHSLIFFYLSINFLHERCRRICRLTFVSRIVWVYSFREGCKILRRGYASSSFTRLQL